MFGFGSPRRSGELLEQSKQSKQPSYTAALASEENWLVEPLLGSVSRLMACLSFLSCSESAWPSLL
jgi:hypothetical protein